MFAAEALDSFQNCLSLYGLSLCFCQWTRATWRLSSCSLQASFLGQCYDPDDLAAGGNGRIVSGHPSQDRPGAGSKGLNELTWLQVLLANVAYEIFTEEIIPQPFMDEPSTVFSQFMPMTPVVRLTRLPLSRGRQQGAISY